MGLWATSSWVKVTTLVILWGDCEHDDGPALKALNRGEPVFLPDGTKIHALPAGTFYDIWEN
jgi:hypothetical protein